VIALARRALSGDLSGPELRGLSREEVETEMEFEAFAVFQVGRLYDIQCSAAAEGSVETAG
jgi:hypothetical protein